jgi:PAS domain S-box-containing protein
MDDTPRKPVAMRPSSVGDPLRLVTHIPIGITVISLDHRILFANLAYGRLLGYPPDELVGRPIASLIYPEDWPLGGTAVCNLQGGLADEVIVAQRHLRRDGVTVSLQARVTLLRDQEGAVKALVFVVTPRDEGATSAASPPGAATTLRVPSRHSPEGAALHRLALLFAKADSPWAALERAVVLTRRLFRAAAVVIALVETGEEADGGERADPPGLVRVPPAAFGPLASRLLTRPRPLLAQATGDTHSLPPELCARLGLAHCTSLMLLPLRHARRPAFGVLAVGARKPRAPYQASDVDLAADVALLVGGALRSAADVAEIRQRAAQAERARIASELHVSAIQALFSMTLMAEGWAQQREEDRLTDTAQQLRQLGEIAHDTLQELLTLSGRHATD